MKALSVRQQQVLRLARSVKGGTVRLTNWRRNSAECLVRKGLLVRLADGSYTVARYEGGT